MNIPAVCRECGAFFLNPNIIRGGPNLKVYMKGNLVGPCPKCGGMGRIPDGVYRYVDRATTLLKPYQRDARVLAQLESILADLRSQKAGRSAVIDRIVADAPELGALVDMLPHKRSQVGAYLEVLMHIIQEQRGNKEKTAPEILPRWMTPRFLGTVCAGFYGVGFIPLLVARPAAGHAWWLQEYVMWTCVAMGTLSLMALATDRVVGAFRRGCRDRA